MSEVDQLRELAIRKKMYAITFAPTLEHTLNVEGGASCSVDSEPKVSYSLGAATDWSVVTLVNSDSSFTLYEVALYMPWWAQGQKG